MTNPYEVKKTDDGKLGVNFQDGYHLDPMEPVEFGNEMAKARAETRADRDRWKARAEALEAQINQPPPAPQAAPVQPGQVDPALRWVGDGLASDDVFVDKMAAKLVGVPAARVKQYYENQVTSDIVASFQQTRQDYPNSPEAAEALLGRIKQEYGWDLGYGIPGGVDPNYIIAAMKATHDDLIREGAYQPLRTDEQNMAANARSGGSTPPPPPQQGSVDNRGAPENEYTMELSKLREMVLKGGK